MIRQTLRQPSLKFTRHTNQTRSSSFSFDVVAATSDAERPHRHTGRRQLRYRRVGRVPHQRDDLPHLRHTSTR